MTTFVLVGIIVVSVILHVLTIRLVIAQLRLIGELGDEVADLKRELEQ